MNKTDGASALPKMLIFHSSYYNRHRDYFVLVSSECIGVHNYQNVLDIVYYYNIFQPDVVILDAAEYVLTNYYFNRPAMTNLAFPPALDPGGFWKNLSMETRVDVSAREVLDSVVVKILVFNVINAWLVCGETEFDLGASERGGGTL